MSIGLSDWNDEKNQSTLKWAIKAKKKEKQTNSRYVA